MAGDRGVVIGDGTFLFPTVGTPFHQQQIGRICCDRSERSTKHFCAALLVPQPENPYGPYSIAVVVHGLEVAQLESEDAWAFRQELDAAGFVDAVCEAKIVGGWDHGGDDFGYFDVRLNATLPFKIVPPEGLEQSAIDKYLYGAEAKFRKPRIVVAAVLGILLLQLIFAAIFSPVFK